MTTISIIKGLVPFENITDADALAAVKAAAYEGWRFGMFRYTIDSGTITLASGTERYSLSGISGLSSRQAWGPVAVWANSVSGGVTSKVPLGRWAAEYDGGVWYLRISAKASYRYSGCTLDIEYPALIVTPSSITAVSDDVGLPDEYMMAYMRYWVAERYISNNPGNREVSTMRVIRDEALDELNRVRADAGTLRKHPAYMGGRI